MSKHLILFSNHSVKNVSSCVLVSPVRDVCRRYTDKCYSVRFFATSNQVICGSQLKFSDYWVFITSRAHFIYVIGKCWGLLHYVALSVVLGVWL